MFGNLRFLPSNSAAVVVIDEKDRSESPGDAKMIVPSDQDGHRLDKHYDKCGHLDITDKTNIFIMLQTHVNLTVFNMSLAS
jgi:hypothetical protein